MLVMVVPPHIVLESLEWANVIEKSTCVETDDETVEGVEVELEVLAQGTVKESTHQIILTVHPHLLKQLQGRCRPLPGLLVRCSYILQR
jgi:hypothetical protein